MWHQSVAIWVSAHALACTLMVLPAHGEWVGAQGAIEQWVSGPKQSPDDKDQTTDTLRADLDAYVARRPRLLPQQAATDWLAFYDRWVASLGEGGREMMQGYGMGRNGADVQLAGLVEALPGPEAWPALGEAVRQRPVGEAGAVTPAELGLRLLVAYLTDDQAAFERDAEAAVTQARAIDAYHAGNLLGLIAPLMDVMSDGASDVAALKEQLARRIATAQQGDEYSFDVPDLVTRLGEPEARALLEQIVVLPVDSLDFEAGDATVKLARTIAVEKIESLARPRWELVNSIDASSVALFEALETKFVKAKPAEQPEGLTNLLRAVLSGGADESYMEEESWDLKEARVNYLLGLIVLERADDAAALVSEHFTGDRANEVDLPYGSLEVLERGGALRQLFAFAQRMVEKPEGAGLWPLYINLGARLERSEEVLARVQAAVDAAEGKLQGTLLNHLVTALLAADRVDEGVSALQRQIEQTDDPDATHDRVPLALYCKLAELGRLLGNPQWQTQGIEGALATLDENAEDDSTDRWVQQRYTGQLVDLLVSLDQAEKAEGLLIKQIGRAVQPPEAQSPFQYRGGDDDEAVEPLIALTAIYADAERWDDVLTLLDETPYWGQDDLADLYGKTSGYADTPLGYYAAQALSNSGRDAEAQTILLATLHHAPGEDKLYALLVESQQQAAIPTLDALFARDRFEERPLIWKARLLLDAGQVDAAEATVREAISIDPSDGEQGRGDRMRAYAVLAEVLRKKGDDATAAVMEGAVRAVRMSEDADRFYAAGLLSRAVSMYQEALTHFADAYCIQSRLAIQLSELGRYEEAAEHYERAYELMPDSFGRVESHCFGCEGAFTGERAQSIAERVLNQLAFTQPMKPQVHYLLGYLASARGDHEAALAKYRRAVELDPDYLNAWAKLVALSGSLHMDRRTQDAAALTIFRLDPLRRHTHSDLSSVRDLAAAWRAVEAAAHLRVEPPRSLYPLTASAEKLKARATDESAAGFGNPFQRHMSGFADSASGNVPTPGEMVAGHQITQLVAQVIELQAMRNPAY